MNRDSTIIQVAILLIIIAILGVAILKKQQPAKEIPTKIEEIQNTQEQIDNTGTGEIEPIETGLVVENTSSKHANLIKQYFLYLANNEYREACGLLSPAKCAANRDAAVELFTNEFLKLQNGYEYLSVRDFGITAPSGKHVTCVKYSYRYTEDTNPGLISEVMAFYTDTLDGQLKITDRVCEKKYKEGRGERACPIQANANFCVGKIK